MRERERERAFDIEKFAFHNAQPEVLFCARCTAIVVIAKTNADDGACSISAFDFYFYFFAPLFFLLVMLVHLPFVPRFIEVCACLI